MDLDINEIRALMADLEKGSLRDLDLQSGNFSLHLSKNENSSQAATPAASPAPAPQAQPQASAPAPQADDSQAATPAPSSSDSQEILAPMVGTVYLQPKPDAPAFKQVGDRIDKGDVVAVIEAMKLMTEIHSEVSGTLSEILVDNEEVVDFDKPLFRVTAG